MRTMDLLGRFEKLLFLSVRGLRLQRSQIHALMQVELRDMSGAIINAGNCTGPLSSRRYTAVVKSSVPQFFSFAI